MAEHPLVLPRVTHRQPAPDERVRLLLAALRRIANGTTDGAAMRRIALEALAQNAGDADVAPCDLEVRL